jgi:hypothetical protein
MNEEVDINDVQFVGKWLVYKGVRLDITLEEFSDYISQTEEWPHRLILYHWKILQRDNKISNILNNDK